MPNLKETAYGLQYEDTSFLLHFGNKNLTTESIKTLYPNLLLSRVKQTHSDSIHFLDANNTPATESADAIISENKSTALCIATADCMPILIYGKNTKYIAAVHAGWRGILNQITLKTLGLLKVRDVALSDLQIIVGPHIQYESFLVREDVLNLFRAQGLQSTDYIEVSEDQYRIDMFAMLSKQLIQMGISKQNIQNCGLNTVSQKDWHSYRRDAQNSGRNLSFISLK